MSKLNLKSQVLGGAALALALAAVSAPAHAQITGLYGGGATFPEKTYRDIMNCYGNTSGGELQAFLAASQATCNPVPSYRSGVEILYVGVGSGNGLNAFIAHDSEQYDNSKTPDRPPVVGTTDLGVFYGTSQSGGGTGTGTDWKPLGDDTGTPYPKVSFTGSDDPFDVTKYNTYQANAAGNGWGQLIQVPGLIGAVAVPYHPTAGTWTEHGKKPLGFVAGGSLVDLSTQTLCGIYTGVITDWSNSEITADNGGVVLGTGTIHPLYRAEGSGTTFLFVNGLINQCALTSHPVPNSWQTAGGNSLGKSDNSWFLHLESAGLIGPGSPLPNFTKVSGSGGMKNTTGPIAGTAGAIGYVSTDFVFPYLQDGSQPLAANIQNFATLLNNTTKKWVAPTPKTATAIMTGFGAPASTVAGTASSPPCPIGPNTTPKPGAIHPTGGDAYESTDGICSHNPLNWGATNPTPTSAGAYPLGGFTFIDVYTCYASAADVSALVSTSAGALGYLRWYYGSATDNGGHPKTSMSANGFSPIPGAWLSAAKKVLTTDQKTKISTPGTAKTGCASVVGAGA